MELICKITDEDIGEYSTKFVVLRDRKILERFCCREENRNEIKSFRR